MPSVTGDLLELGPERPVARDRERAAAPLRARRREGREQPRDVLARDEVADEGDARTVRVPSERGRRDLRVAVDERLQIDARADDVQAVAERAGDCLQAHGEVVRDGEHRAGAAEGLQRRLADPRRALGVGDVGAVRRERVGTRAARAACRAIVPVGTR